MKVPQFVRKFFGMKPIVGDKVDGFIDYGISYCGEVTDIGLYYEVKGKISIDTIFSIDTKFDDKIFVPHSRIKHL